MATRAGSQTATRASSKETTKSRLTKEEKALNEEAWANVHAQVAEHSEEEVALWELV